MAQLTWEAMNPIDTSRYLDAIQKAQAQSVAGVEQIGNAYRGYQDNLKKQNTNDMLTALNQAQNPEQLAAAQANIAAMQQRWGSGYDMDAVRTAMDERPTVLNQRAMQAIQYQQAKAQNDAMPMVNKAIAGIVNSREGITPEQQALVSKIAEAGYDTTGIMNTLGNTVVGDFRDKRTYATGRSDRAEDLKIAKDARDQAQENWESDREFRDDESNWKRGGEIAAENPGGNTLSFDGEKWVTATTPKITRMDAYGALSGVRGIRNNNPGNLGFAGQKGASRENGSGRFAAFNTPEEGLAAMSKQLDLFFTGKSKNVKGPAQTVQAIISAWAPPNENDTRAYVNQVSKALGVNPNDRINLNDPKVKTALMQQIVKKENGGNPYSPEQYAAGIAGNFGTAAAASNAIQIPQATAAKAVSGYNIAITELNNKFNLQTTKDQSKTGMGTKGQTIDSWLISKSTKDREGSTLITDYASKVAKLARNNAKLSNLPMDDQIRVLDAAHAWALAPGGVITDKHLNARITNLATSLIDGKKNELAQGKKNIFEAQYQAFVQELNAAGMSAISRDAFKQLVSPELSLKATKVTVKTPPASQSSKATAKTGEVSNPFHSTPTPKPASKPASQAFVPYANAGVKDKASVRATPKLPFTSTGNMTPQQVNDLLKKYNVR